MHHERGGPRIRRRGAPAALGLHADQVADVAPRVQVGAALALLQGKRRKEDCQELKNKLDAEVGRTCR